MKEKIVVLDRGNVEFLYPVDWNVSRSSEGYLTLSDPTESCRLEVSYTKVPAEAASVPVERLLQQLLTHIPEAGSNPEIDTAADANRHFAWTDYSYPSTDKRTGDAADAHGRWLLGGNGLFQILMTFYYWADDAVWAVPKWERIFETVQLGNGSQLESPEDHWSRQRRN
jgi:hypothetical protein